MNKPSRFGGLRDMQGKRDEEIQTPTLESKIPLSTMPIDPVDIAAPKRGRPATGRRSNPEYEGVMGYIPKVLYKQVKRHMLEEDIRDFSEVLEEVLGEWVKNRGSIR